MIPLSKIIEFFDSYDFQDQECHTLSPCEKIFNLERFVKTHLEFLKNNKGNKIYRPYYDRLLTIYKNLNK